MCVCLTVEFVDLDVLVIIILVLSLFRKWDVKRLTWEQDIEPYAVDRDNKIEKIAKV